tara:strand:- start:319 stop:993 length:675 start_codon:yes stop_codon:yes gene_type:complete
MPQQKSKKILIYLFLFLIVGTFNNKNLYNSNFLKLNQISIKGLDKKNNPQLIDSLNSLKNSNLFFLKEKKIKEIINANSLVEGYSVFKIYPSSLDIKIDKTNFLAQLKRNNDNYLLGSNGKLSKINSNKKYNLPYIFGEFSIEDFFELKNIIDETNFNYNEIKNLFFFKSGRWDIELNNGVLIKLPNYRLKKSFELVISFFNRDNAKDIKQIDLRQYNQIIVNG